MANPRFYVTSPLQVGSNTELGEIAAHHAVRVLRLRPGDVVVLFNGDGNDYSGHIQDIARRAVKVHLTGEESIDNEASVDITLIQAVSGGERMDYTIQKAVELGVRRIVPVLSERVIVRLPADRVQKRHRHWNQIVISACEQCGRNRLPEISPILSLDEVLNEDVSAGVHWILSPDSGNQIHGQSLADKKVHLLAGPEGGFSESETALAINAGYLPIKLGPRILRTETAALAAMAAIHALWGDFQTD